MYLEKIIVLPNPHLRLHSQKVGIISKDIAEIIRQMQAATLEWEDSRDQELGVALAAIQIDQPLKIIVIRNDFDNKDDHAFHVFINPEITKFEGTIEKDFEGCLSIPDIYGKVPRYSKVRVKAQDLQGKEIRITTEGFLARVFQHEIDHTKGKLFTDYIRDETKAFFKLTKEHKLEQLNYEKDVRNNNILW